MFDELTKSKIEKISKNFDIPKYEEIVTDYEEILNLLKNVKDISKLKEIEKEYHLSIEVNSLPLNEFNEENEIAFVRVDHFKNLDCIYFNYDNYVNGNFNSNLFVYFDVWFEECFDGEIYLDVIVDTTITRLENDYKSAIEYIWDTNDLYKEYE